MAKVRPYWKVQRARSSRLHRSAKWVPWLSMPTPILPRLRRRTSTFISMTSRMPTSKRQHTTKWLVFKKDGLSAKTDRFLSARTVRDSSSALLRNHWKRILPSPNSNSLSSISGHGTKTTCRLFSCSTRTVTWSVLILLTSTLLCKTISCNWVPLMFQTWTYQTKSKQIGYS